MFATLRRIREYPQVNNISFDDFIYDVHFISTVVEAMPYYDLEKLEETEAMKGSTLDEMKGETGFMTLVRFTDFRYRQAERYGRIKVNQYPAPPLVHRKHPSKRGRANPCMWWNLRNILLPLLRPLRMSIHLH